MVGTNCWSRNTVLSVRGLGVYRKNIEGQRDTVSGKYWYTVTLRRVN